MSSLWSQMRLGAPTPLSMSSNWWRTSQTCGGWDTSIWGWERCEQEKTGHDCFFGLPNWKASCSGWTTYRSNLVSPEQNWRCHSVGVLNWKVLRKLIYGLNTAMFESRPELPGLTMGDEAQGVLTGVPQNGTGHRIPCDKFSRRRTLWALLRDISARWAQSTRRCLETWFFEGAGNGMGWLLRETPGTQVSRSPLTSLLRELHRWKLPKWATLLFFAHL